MAQLTVHISVRWWLKPAIALIIGLSRIGLRPTDAFIDRLLRRAVIVR
jgi:hypothetical protein